MAAKKTPKNFDFVPANYEELFNHYVAGTNNGGSSIVRTLVRTFMTHGTDDEMETLTQDVFLRCLDKKVIEGYNPEKANFGGVIYFVTRSVCANYLDRKSRDPISGLYGGSLVSEDPEDGTFTPGTWNLERFSVPAQDIAKSYESHEQVQWLVDFARNASAKPRNKRDESLLPLLNLLMEEFTPQECAEQLKVTTTTVTNWMKYLAEIMQDRLGVTR